MLDSHGDEGVLNHESRVPITADEDMYGDSGMEVAPIEESRAVAKVLSNKLKLFVSVQWAKSHFDCGDWEAVGAVIILFTWLWS
jgi:hypothetical protein